MLTKLFIWILFDVIIPSLTSDHISLVRESLHLFVVWVLLLELIGGINPLATVAVVKEKV